MSRFAVLTLTYKKRHINQNPELPRRCIKLVPVEKAEKAMQSKEFLKKEFGKKYKRILRSGDDAPAFFEYKHEAYRYILKRIQDVEASRGRIKFYDRCGYQVYIIELSSDVRDYSKMSKSNGARLIEKADTFCYVGQTYKSAEERYGQHRNPEHINSSNWGKKYFKVPFESAYRVDLLDAFTAATNQDVQGLKESEAHIVEADVALWLRERGIAAHFN